MRADADVFDGGFADPVFEAQDVFRRLMNAMARPGTIESVATTARPPAPLSPVSGALALALFDADTPVWLDPTLAGAPDVTQWLRFHTGVAITADAATAQFALIADPSRLERLDGFAQGEQAYPDRSTTLIIEVGTLTGGVPMTLTGPGIRTQASIAPVGLPETFADQWAANHALFPRGVDVVLASAGGLVALPRTTRLTTGAS